MYLIRKGQCLNKASYLHRQAGSCSNAACRSSHSRRFCHCPPTGTPPCTRRPTRCRWTSRCRSPRRRSRDGEAGSGCRTDLRTQGQLMGHKNVINNNRICKEGQKAYFRSHPQISNMKIMLRNLDVLQSYVFHSKCI